MKNIYIIFYFLIGATALSAIPELDFKDWDCQEKLEIGGEWQFYWEQFVDSNYEGSSSTINLPRFWQGLVINGEELPPFGYASFRKKVQVPETSEVIGLQIEHIHSSYRVIINGELIYESGKVADNKEEYQPMRLPKVIELPKATSYDIIIHAANFDHYRGGILNSPSLVNMKAFVKYEERQRFIDTFIAGGAGLIGLTFLIIFIFSRRTSEVIFFAMFSLTLSIRLLISGQYPLHFIMDITNDFRWLMRLEYITLFALLVFGALYIPSLFPNNKERRIYNILALIGMGYVTVTMFGSIKTFTSLTPSFLLMNLFLLIMFTYTVIKGVLIKDRSAWILLVALVVIFAWAVLDSLVYVGVLDVNRVIYSALFLGFVMINNLALMDRFASEIKVSQERKAMLEAIESRKLLMSMISHEIKTPLSQLQMNSKMLDMIVDDKEKEPMLKKRVLPRIKTSINSLQRMLNDFLYFMNIDQHKTEDLEKSEFVKKLETLLEIDVRHDSSQQFSFSTNSKVLLYALSTFVSNAVKYTPEGNPPPEIKINNDNNATFIEVKDYGKGMDEERLAKMGSLQIDTSDILEVQGIGFYLANKLLESIGHTVKVESTLNKGTSVYVTI